MPLFVLDKILNSVFEGSPPFEAGTKAGRLIYYLDDTEIGEVPIVTKEGIQKAGFSDYLEKVYRNFMSICG